MDNIQPFLTNFLGFMLLIKKLSLNLTGFTNFLKNQSLQLLLLLLMFMSLSKISIFVGVSMLLIRGSQVFQALLIYIINAKLN